MMKYFWRKLATAAVVASMVTLTACGGGSSKPASSAASNPASSAPSSSAASSAAPKVNFPQKEVTLLVPYGAGGGTDMTARALAKSAEKFLGKSVIVVNKTGGSGLVGYTEGASSKPDGYTVTVAAIDLTMLPHLVNTPISYQSFKPVMQVNADTAAITVKADAPWKTAKEFFDYAKANPGKVKMGHGGVGSVWHIITASHEKAMNVKFNQVPFDSGGATVAPLLGGHIDATPITYAEVKANVDSGKLKTLAVLESKPADIIPKDLKTFEGELGVKPLIPSIWRGLIVPKDTPDDVVKVLEEAFTKAVADPEFKAFMDKSALGISVKDSKSFGEFMKQDHENFGKIISELGLKK